MPVAEVVHLVRAKVHPEPGADDRFSCWSPGNPRQAQPRHEVRAVRKIERCALRAKASARKLHDGNAAKHLMQDSVILVSQSQIEGEVGAYLERILHIGHDIRAPIAAKGQLPNEAIVIKNVINEILRATVRECPRSDPLGRIVQSMALDAYPYLDCVPPPNDAQIVVTVNRGADLRVEIVCVRGIEAGHAPPDIAGLTVGRRGGRRSIRVVVHGGAVESSSDLVNNRRREDVR